MTEAYGFYHNRYRQLRWEEGWLCELPLRRFISASDNGAIPGDIHALEGWKVPEPSSCRVFLSL